MARASVLIREYESSNTGRNDSDDASFEVQPVLKPVVGW
jgi:hypothetical protein